MEPVLERWAERSLLKHHFEVSLHCSAESVTADDFLDEHVKLELELDSAERARKGFMVTLEDPTTLSETYMSVQASKSSESSFLLFFTYDVIDHGHPEEVFDTAVVQYQRIQQQLNVAVLEQV